MNGVKSEDTCRIESISMKFDVFMKKVIRGRVRNAVCDYIKQMDRFPLWSTNAIESMAVHNVTVSKRNTLLKERLQGA